MSGDPGRDIMKAKASLQAMAATPPLQMSRTAMFASLAGAFTAGFVLVRFPAARAGVRAMLIHGTRELARRSDSARTRSD